MGRFKTTVVIALTLLLAACGPQESSSRDAMADRPADGLDEYHVEFPLDGVRDVMQAKLMHTHAMFEGLVLEDLEQVESNAKALAHLSRTAGWRVHTTVAYGIFSDEFTEIAETMARDARAGDFPAVVKDHRALVSSCVRCHSYMRGEGLYRELPGDVSFVPAAPPAGSRLTRR